MTKQPLMVSTLKKFDQILGHVEHLLLALFLCTLVIVGTYQSIASHLFQFNATWPFELIRYTVFFIALTGAALAAKEGQMIGMDFLSRLIPKRWIHAVNIVIALFVVGVLALTILGGMNLRQTTLSLSESYEFIAPDIGVMALPIAASLIAVHYINHGLISLVYFIQPPLDNDKPSITLH